MQKKKEHSHPSKPDHKIALSPSNPRYAEVSACYLFPAHLWCAEVGALQVVFTASLPGIKPHKLTMKICSGKYLCVCVCVLFFGRPRAKLKMLFQIHLPSAPLVFIN